MAASPLQSALDMRPATPSAKSKGRMGYERPAAPTLDIPIQTFSVWDSVQLVQAALADLEQGNFLNAAILCDAMGRDDRITATLSARVNGVLSSPLEFDPGVDSAKGRKVAEDLKLAWAQIFPEGELAQLVRWGRLVGAAPGELTWTNTDKPGGSGKQWLPKLKVWHPQFMQWRWDWRDYSVITAGGIERLETGLGRWTLYTPNGRYPSWQSGLVRGLAIPFLIRWWAYRDWARYSEKHGLPIFKAQVPKGADEDIKSRFFNSVAALGSENTVKLEQGTKEEGSFDIGLVEPTANTWMAFQGLIQQCDSSVAILILGQNLTTEVKGGSFAAAQVHDQVRADFKGADAGSLSTFIRDQILKPWAAFNYGDPELAPVPKWAVDPPEDTQKIAQTALTTAQAITAFKSAGSPVDERAFLEKQGIPLLSEAEAAKLAADTAARDAKAAADAKAQADAAAAVNPGDDQPADDEADSPDDASSAQKEAAMNAKGKIDPPVPRAAVEGQMFTDAVGDKAVSQGAAALEPDLAGLLADIQAASDYEDVRRRILVRHARMDRKNLARLVERAILLAELGGRFAVRREAVKP